MKGLKWHLSPRSSDILKRSKEEPLCLSLVKRLPPTHYFNRTNSMGFTGILLVVFVHLSLSEFIEVHLSTIRYTKASFTIELLNL
jgi:hypothetical protein